MVFSYFFRKCMKILKNPRKLKNSPNLLLLFVKITKFLEFSIKISIKTIVFLNSDVDYNDRG